MPEKMLEEYDYDNQSSEEIVHSFHTKHSNWLGWTTLVLVILIAAIGTWLVYEAQNKVVIINKAIGVVNSQLLENKNQIQTINTNFAQQEEKFNQIIDSSVKRYVNYFQAIEKKLQQPEKYFYLRETLSGLQITQWLLTFQKDIFKALPLMRFIVSRIDNLAYIPASVKNTLSNDLLSLEQYTEPQQAKIIAKINIISKEILPTMVLKTYSQMYKQNISNENKTVDKKWKEKALSFFKKFVIIKKKNKMARPLIVEENKDILIQNIQLLLRQAEISLIQRNADQFNNILIQAKEWLVGYYDVEEETTKKGLKLLDELLNENVSFDLPNVQASIIAINAILNEQKH